MAEVVVAVVTPPEYSARPYAPPSDVPGLWLLDTASDEVEKQGERWVHRTRVRVRAQEAGRFEYPGGMVDVEGPNGAVEALEIEPLAVELEAEVEAEEEEAEEQVAELPPCFGYESVCGPLRVCR